LACSRWKSGALATSRWSWRWRWNQSNESDSSSSNSNNNSNKEEKMILAATIATATIVIVLGYTGMKIPVAVALHKNTIITWEALREVTTAVAALTIPTVDPTIAAIYLTALGIVLEIIMTIVATAHA
jgi:hypothetical protein